MRVFTLQTCKAPKVCNKIEHQESKTESLFSEKGKKKLNKIETTDISKILKPDVCEDNIAL